MIFLKILKEFEIYFKMTEYLRLYIRNYITISLLLQLRKIALLKIVLIRGKSRKKFLFRTTVKISIIIKFEIFELIQRAFFKLFYFVYYNSLKTLFVDLNLLKLEIGAIIFYIKGDRENLKKLIIDKLKFIILKDSAISGLYSGQL